MGVQQVNAAVNQMDQSTQQNATMVEQSTAAAHSLSQEATKLATLVEQFKVGVVTSGAMRAELQKVAPHAFAKPAAPLPRSSAPPGPAPRAAQPPGLRKTAGGDDWDEF